MCASVRRIIPSLCVFVLLASFLAPVSARAERLPMRLYTTTDGMWSSAVNYVMRDSHGFLWFCTRDGLSRFDGYRFVNYRVGDGSQQFIYMFETRSGVFWIVRNFGGVYRYDPNSSPVRSRAAQSGAASDDGRVVLNADLVSEDGYGSMLEDRNGNLWAAGTGLFLMEEKAGHVFFHPVELNLPQNLKQSLVVHAIAEGQDGSLWLGTSQGLVRRFPDGRVTHLEIHRDAGLDYTQTVLADRDGRIWVGHMAGLFVFQPAPLSTFQTSGAFSSRRLNAHLPIMQDGHLVLPSTPGEAVDLTSVEAVKGATPGKRGNRPRYSISRLYQQANGQIWTTVNGRLLLIDGQRFQSYLPGENEGGFGQSVEDLDGDLWIASSGGPMRFSLQGFRSYDRADGLRGAQIDSIYEDGGGSLQVINGNWFVSRLNAGKFQSIRPNIPPDVTRLWTSTAVFLDHTGQWWILTDYGLYRFAPVHRLEDLAHATPSAIYTDFGGLPADKLYCMFEDSNGDLWISIRWTEEGVSGLLRWQRSTGTWHRFHESEGLPPGKSAASFAQDNAGNLWFGFYEGGLLRYAKDRFTYFSPADGLPEGFITALHVDQRGRLWLASASNGLSRIDDPTAERPRFVSYTSREGLSSNNVRCITEDLMGRIYIGTVRGIERLAPETGKIRHYGVVNGLAADFVTSAYRDHNGALWFGTFNGLSRLDPQPEAPLVPPSIMIDGLSIAGVKQPISELGSIAVKGLELTSAQHNLEIEYSSLSIANADSLRYQYKLQGTDRDWSPATSQRTVNYANLAPGSYDFLVRAVDSSGLTSPQPASVSFRILPPLWQQWWFLALTALVAAYIVRAVYRYRVARLLELERVRTRIATDLHDDIGSSLSQIAVLSEVVRRQVDGTADAAKPLSTIAATSRELVDSMSDIVWAINPHRDHLSDLSQRMRRFASDLFTAHDIEFRVDIEETDRPIKLEADVRREVFLIFKECVHNIVRHSGCANAAIGLRTEDHSLRLTLKDDGKGFDTTQTSDGHGLMSMRRRAQNLHAVLEVTSSASFGTSISLQVPLARRRGLG